MHDENSDRVKIELVREEKEILSSAINEVCNGPEAIEDWEFETRMGCKRSEAVALLEKITQLYQVLSDRPQT